jgi:hypothetical protein
MSCCGQNREKARSSITTPVATQSINRATEPARVAAKAGVTSLRAAPLQTVINASAKLHYTGVAAIQVKGPKTGRTYSFSGNAPDATIDRRDAEGLIRIGLFRRAV